jgi:UDP-sugar diphosphatase
VRSLNYVNNKIIKRRKALFTASKGDVSEPDGFMNREIKNFKIEPLLEEGKFVKPKVATYTQDGESRSWEIVEVNDSVAILIYNRDLKKFIFVKQFRPALYPKNGDGVTIELCAGIVDKSLSLEEIASEEVFEECGYGVKPDSLEKINSFYTSVGFAASKQTLFYVEVNNAMVIGDGGGVENEKIEIVEMDRDEAKKLIFDDEVAKTTGFCFAISWWFMYKDV